jgi:hypothetical protein
MKDRFTFNHPAIFSSETGISVTSKEPEFHFFCEKKRDSILRKKDGIPCIIIKRNFQNNFHEW